MENDKHGRAGISGTALKVIAIISMLIDHVGMVLVGPLTDTGAVPVWVYFVMRDVIGRLAFPIFCFLLVEGYAHTHSKSRYLARIAVFAIISEIPFDLATSGQWYDSGAQNVFWTLAFGLAALMVCEKIKQLGNEIAAFMLSVLAICACATIAEILNTDYGWMGVAAIGLMYLSNKIKYSERAAFGILPLVLYEPAVLLDIPIIASYNGKRGRCGRVLRWAFYAFYPIHLAVLGAIMRFVPNLGTWIN